MPSVTLVVGPSASGKTRFVVERATERYAADAFAPTLALVPTVRHGDQLRRRLVERCGVAFDLDVSTIGIFARRVAPPGQVPPAAVADELLRRVTQRRIADGEATYLAPIAGTPGLESLVARAVADLLEDAIEADAFRRAAAGTAEPGLVALADIHGAYVAELAERGWADPRSLPALAARAVRDGASVPPVVFVDGFQMLRSVEIELLVALADHADLVVTIDPTAGDRAGHTSALLAAHFPHAGQVAVSHGGPSPSVEATTVPTAEAQLRAMVRSIKEQLTADRTLRPSDFALTFRQAMPALALARQVFAE